ncbi:MAG: ABC transporter ATP-binding protein [Candidatus Methylacidiphilales bacterium]|nr:ABC transporter ATP-binding protein [Candidatus Methylacidiphilales bacterium]
MNTGFQTTGLTVRFGKLAVLHEVDFHLAPGGLHGLIGPNGAGKTTLLRVLAGLVPPQEGNLSLDGTDWTRIDRATRARTAGYLPQNGTCHWPLTVERLVELGRIPHQGSSSALLSHDHAAVERALEETDTRSLRTRPVTELSGGERARVFLARVLAGQPRVLLIDEPLAGLDLYHQLQVMELLRAIATEPGRLVTVVMHDLSLALRYCTTLTLLDAGRRLWTGAPEALLQTDLLNRVFRVDLQALETREGSALVPIRRLSC